MNDEITVAIQRVRDLHRRGTIYEVADDCPDQTDAHAEARHFESVDGEWLCQDRPLWDVCTECRDRDGELVDWPCDTIHALAAVGPASDDENGDNR